MPPLYGAGKSWRPDRGGDPRESVVLGTDGTASAILESRPTGAALPYYAPERCGPVSWVANDGTYDPPSAFPLMHEARESESGQIAVMSRPSGSRGRLW
jgi:hypothetical protein